MRALTKKQTATLIAIAHTGSSYVTRKDAEQLVRRGFVAIRDLSPCGRRWTARLTTAGLAEFERRKFDSP